MLAIKLIILALLINFTYGGVTNSVMSVGTYKNNNAVDFDCSSAGVTLFKKDDSNWYLIFDKSFKVKSLILDKLQIPGLISITQVTNFTSSIPCTVLSVNVAIGTKLAIFSEKNHWFLTTKVNNIGLSKLMLKPDKIFSFTIGTIYASNSINLKLDNLDYYILPSIQDDRGLDKTENFNPYLEVIPSVQGVAILLKSDCCKFTLNKNNLQCDLNGIPIVPIMADNVPIPQSGENNLIFTPVIKVDDWPEYLEEFYEKIRMNPNNSIEQKIEQAWTECMLGHGKESQKVLIEIAMQPENINSNKVVNSLVYKALLAMTKILCNKYKEAKEILHNLPPIPELQVLSVICDNALKKHPTLPDFTKEIILKFPIFLRENLMNFIWQNLKYYPTAVAQQMLDYDMKPISEHYKARFNLALANFLSSLQKHQDAIKIYNKLTDPSSNIPIQIFAEANFRLLLEEIPHKKDDEIIEQLEKIRFIWRGDELELEITNKLTEYLKKKQNYFRILEILHNLLALFPDTPELNQMILDNISLYFAQDLSKISPLRTITIFNNFTSQVSSNKAYEKILLQVIDQYIKVDLLQNAIELLFEHAVRINHIDRKVPLLLKVAGLQLLNRSPDFAQYTVDIVKSYYPNHPQIRLLEVEIKLQKKQFNEAISLLQGDPSIQAKQQLINRPSAEAVNSV